MLIAITIAVILASFVGVSFKKYVETKRREVEIITFWKELCGLRAKAMKYDYRYIVTFNTGANTYKIFKDADNGNDADDPSELQPSPFIPKIVFGYPSGLGSGPAGTAAPAAAVDGNWSTDGGIKIERDNIGTINQGRIFFKVPEIPNIAYCITVLANKQTIKLYKWTGAQWIEM